jgi:ribosomal protein S18 acetylase RimI-like enzyme
VGDAAAIASVHVESTLATYRDIWPDDYLDNISVEERTEQHRRLLANAGAGTFSYVAEGKYGVVGWAVGQPEQEADPTYVGELGGIYVLPDYQRRGIDRRLAVVVAGTLIEAGLESMLVWVIAENWPARRFYMALGGRYVREGEMTVGGARFVKVAYGWRELGDLAAG